MMTPLMMVQTAMERSFWSNPRIASRVLVVRQTIQKRTRMRNLMGQARIIKTQVLTFD